MRTASEMSKMGEKGGLGDAKTYSLILFLVDIVLIPQRTASSRNKLRCQIRINEDGDGEILSGFRKAVRGFIYIGRVLG